MIQNKSILKISDNSGAKTVQCIKVLKGFKKKKAMAGSSIVVSVRQLRNKAKKSSKVLKGEVLKGFLLRTKKKVFNKDGSAFSFDANSCVLLSNTNALLGTRVIGPVSRKYQKGSGIKWTSASTGFF